MANHSNRRKKIEAAKDGTKVQPDQSVSSYKGFDQDFRCRDFQFEVGKTYDHVGEVKVCASGFHACEHPLDVFTYYPPATSRYAEVTQSGVMQRHDDDTKIVSAKIKIEAEISLTVLIERAVKWVFDRAKWVDGLTATGPNEAATARAATTRTCRTWKCASR